MISAALAAGLALTMTVTAFADEPYTAYNYDYWDDAIPSQSAYRVEKTVTGADMGLDRLSDPSDPLYISDDAPAKLSDAKDLFYDQDNDTFWVCDSGNNRILRSLILTAYMSKRASLMISFMFTSQIQTIQGLLSVLLSQAQK